MFQRPDRAALKAGALPGATAILLCGMISAVSSAEPAAPHSAMAVPPRSGVVETSMGTYAFATAVCAIYEENGAYDIEIEGPGTAPDGENIYFSLSSTGNEISIALGAEGPFAGTDRRLAAGRYVSQEFSIVVSGRSVTASGLLLVDQNGGAVDATAGVAVNCAT